MRLMSGKPLISYAIQNALASDHIDAVVVSSDSEEVLSYAGRFEGVVALDRQSSLAEDAVTLDPVIYDALCRAEQELGVRFDVVVTLQPTSPLLSVETLDAALRSFVDSEIDSLISVVNAPHLSWKRESDRIVPEYAARLNRQQLPPRYLETGAFLITRRECVTQASRIGDAVSVFEVPEAEAVDIDTVRDWAMCESALSRKRVAFRVDGYRELGLGHIYRALTLAYAMTEHDVVFVCDRRFREGIEKLRSANMRIAEVEGDAGVIEWLRENAVDVLVNDTLDTDAGFVQEAKRLVDRVVTFEDLGEGSRFADAVVNAIYEKAPAQDNAYVGKSYVALRDEFQTAVPKPFSERVERVLVMFGGTDPLDLSSRLHKIARSYNADGIKIWFDFILGPGYSGKGVEACPECGICVVRDAIRVTDYMAKADLAFSSQGRTTFELASMGVPTVVLAQNEREQLHSFAQMDNGFINLGLGSEVTDGDIAATLDWIVNAPSVRREMNRLMLANDLKAGIERVKKIVLGEVL